MRYSELVGVILRTDPEKTWHTVEAQVKPSLCIVAI
jgi:hypothetical protein